MNLQNDNGCGWLNQLPERLNIKILNKDLICDYLIIGAGYTGLSTARKLSEIDKNKKLLWWTPNLQEKEVAAEIQVI